MNPLPSIASSNIANLFTKPIPRHQHTQLFIGIGVNSTTPVSASAHLAPTVVAAASATVVAAASATVVAAASDSVPTASALPIVLDTGASYSRAPSASDFLPVTQAPYGLYRSAASLVLDSKLTSVASKATSTPVDPYTLITGEDVSADPIDLSSPDITTIAIGSDSGPSFSGPSFIKVHFDVRQFGTASLTFIFSPNWSLIKVFVTPTQVDCIHWVPLPRLTPTESYFHIFGRDYLQAFALFHLIPIWIALVSALLRSE